MTIKSWDPASESADLNTTDGRSYVRVIGGSAEFTHVVFADLGFWSGRTGGVALTGTESAPTTPPPTSATPRCSPPTAVIPVLRPHSRG